MPTPDYYRKRADEMRKHAERAATAELRASYLTIGNDWERLALQAEASLSETMRPPAAHSASAGTGTV